MDANAYKDLGNKAFQAKNFEEAIKNYSEAIKLNPNDHIYYSNRSGAYASLWRNKEALEDAEACLRIKPDFGKGFSRKGLALGNLGRFSEAKQAYSKAIELEPSVAAHQDSLKRVIRFEGLLGTLKKLPPGINMQQLFMSHPKTKEYFTQPDFISKIMQIGQDPFSVMRYMDDPRVAECVGLIEQFGQIFNNPNFNMDPKEDGPESSTKMDEEFPRDSSEPRMETEEEGESKPKPSAPPKREEPRKASPPPQPKAPEPSNESEKEKLLGNQFYKERKFTEALEHYNKAIELDEFNLVIRSNKAAVYIEMGEYDKVISTVDEGIEKFRQSTTKDVKTYAKLLARKAKAYNLKGEFETALELYDKSLLEDKVDAVKTERKLCEKKKKEKDDLAYINPELAEKARNEGNALLKEGKFPEAIKAYDEAIRRDPSDPRSYSNKSTALVKLGEFPSALTEINKALDKDPTFVKGYIRKAGCHFSMREYHKAIEVYDAGLKIDPTNAELIAGKNKTEMTIMGGGSSSSGAAGDSNEEEQERLRHAMADPEIQALMSDPMLQIQLQNASRNPQEMMKMFNDPEMGPKIRKLINAGIIKTK